MEGNCDVLSLPRRDATTRASRFARRGEPRFDFNQRANAVVLRFEDEMTCR